jgi:hypothetical protein
MESMEEPKKKGFWNLFRSKSSENKGGKLVGLEGDLHVTEKR